MVAVVVGAVAMGATLTAGCGDESEQDRTVQSVTSAVKQLKASLLQCGETRGGHFAGLSSVHLYALDVTPGATYRLRFEGSYAASRGAGLLVLDPLGAQVALGQDSQASEVAVTFQAGSSPARYWVAVYSVQLWCTGDYSLKLVCKGVPSSCGATGGRCVPFAKGCAAGEVAGAPLGCAGAPGKLCCKPPVFLRALKASYRAQLEQPLEEALGASAEAMRSRLDPVEALLTNNLGEAIFVSLASDLGLEEQTPSGWQATPAGKSIYPQRDLALAPGESAVVLPSPALAPTPGAWRLALTYRRGCAAGQPVSDDSCAAIASATSAAFTAKVCPAATPPDLAACPHRELRTVFAADGVCAKSTECVPLSSQSFSVAPVQPTLGPGEALVSLWGSSATDLWAVGGALPAPPAKAVPGKGEVPTDKVPADKGEVPADKGEVPADKGGAGTTGTLLHFDGAAWTSFAPAGTPRLNDVWGTASNNVFAVGEGGTILRFDGSSWSAMPSGTSASLGSIHGSSATNIYVVASTAATMGAGWSSSLLRFDGSAWSPVALPASAVMRGPLASVWVGAEDDVWVAGASGTLLHFDGLQWSAVAAGALEHLGKLWGGPADLFALGQPGLGSVLLHFDGAAWAPATGVLSSVFAAGAGAAGALTLGLARNVWSYQASSGWSATVLPSTPGIIVDALALPSGAVFVLGSSGHLFHRP